MTAQHLKEAILGVDWAGLATSFCDDADLAVRVQECNKRLAVWAGQIEQIDAGNGALPFIREMQRAGHYVAALIALSMFRPAAASMRSSFECSLYYSFFRHHPVELNTLARSKEYYLKKDDVLTYFKAHIVGFAEKQAALSLLDRIKSWYSGTSAIVHGQVPGVWGGGTALPEGGYDSGFAEVAIVHFEKCVSVVQDVFLCSMAEDVRAYFDPEAKKYILHGYSGAAKSALGL
mgnify:CR=1 FL=1